jgi:CYTH domain-containing protein
LGVGKLVGTEIERKFRVNDGAWRNVPGQLFRQGYLNRDPDRTVRVRIAGDRGRLTVKGRTRGMSRPEFEYDIPVQDAEELLEMCDGPLIEKIRRVVPHGGRNWEVDEFFGENRGLILAEIELDAPEQPVEKPGWLREEVTGDPRYYNVNLIARPYTAWQDEPEKSGPREAGP